MSADAYHMTQPAPEGRGAVRSIKAALRSAGLTPDDVDYVNAHGTSTGPNDRNETAALKSALGDRAYRIPISSTKSMTGHMLGAAGAVEAMFCALAIRDGIIPPQSIMRTRIRSAIWIMSPIILAAPSFGW